MSETNQSERKHAFVVEALIHELAQPLFSISTICKITEHQLSCNAPKKVIERQIKHIQSASAIMRQIITNYRVITDQEMAGHTNSEISLKETLHRCIDLVQFTCEESADNIHLYIEPKTNDHRFSELVMPLFFNLLLSAVKYGIEKEGRRHITISARHERKNNHAVVDFTHHGDGILVQDMERIFEPFERGENVREIVAGQGLGLHVAKKICTRLGGRIELHRLYNPTVFRVHLPVKIN